MTTPLISLCFGFVIFLVLAYKMEQQLDVTIISKMVHMYWYMKMLK